jgi:hypothetical protein
MTDRSTSKPKTSGRDQEGRFLPGKSGNPAGRPVGARHAALLALDVIGSAAAVEVMGSVVAAARTGDMRAADILLRRLWPERRGRPVTFALPPLRTLEDLTCALAAVAKAIGDGDLSPEEGQSVAAALETWRKAVETTDIEQRLAALEQAAKEKVR